ncbi:MAG TPA: phosphoglycolate phosphatase [Gammaproteobacteria bacterium]|nr:phosphoglycolate phosphatase [Gammaproteobacteria bacterium]
MPIGLVAFDLDGTLVDSVPDIAFAVDQTLKELGLPPLGHEQVRGLVGDGVTRLLKRALTGERNGNPDAKQLERAMALFRRAYSEHLCVDSRLYPGALDLLNALQGRCRLACITNKSSVFTDPLLAALGVDRYFDLTVSGDTLPALKPDPRPLSYAAERFRLAPRDCCMVGDSRNDVLAAKAAGFRALALSYGYRQGEDLMALKPEAQFDSLPELLPWLEGAGLAAPAASG